MQELASLNSILAAAIERFRDKYESLDEAYRTYAAQYGESYIKLYEPFRISGTIDPVTIVLGKTTPLFYKDSKKSVTGSLGSFSIMDGEVYILGRREPQDSKLLVWSSSKEIEIENYDTRASISPSRVHAAIFGLEKGEVLFADLGSTAGSILAGETLKPEPFVVIYKTPATEIHRIDLAGKYARQNSPRP